MRPATEEMYRCDFIAFVADPDRRKDLLPSQQYDLLPECIKSAYTPEQYAWLSDKDKETLIQRETEPEDE